MRLCVKRTVGNSSTTRPRFATLAMGKLASFLLEGTLVAGGCKAKDTPG